MNETSNENNVKNTNKVILTIIIIVAVIICGIGIGGGVYYLNNKPNNDNNLIDDNSDNGDNIDNSSGDNSLTEDNCKYNNNSAASDYLLKNKCGNITKEELKKEGFEELDFKSINVNTEMKTDYEEYDFSTKKFDSVNALEGNGTIGLPIGDPVESQNLDLILENNKAYFYFNDNKIEMKVDSVKSIYVHSAECTANLNMYLLTTNGDVYELNTEISYGDIKSEDLEKFANSFKKLTISQKFVRLTELHTGDATCGYHYDVLGITASGEKYSLNNNRKYDYVRELELNQGDNEKYYVKSNREIEYKGKIIYTNIKQILGNLDNYFINEDDYLYSLDKNSKVENSKIKTIYYNIEDFYAERYIIEFENNNKLILMWIVD